MPMQVVDFTFQGGAVELNIGEAHVGKISLQFVDAKTGDVKEVGRHRGHQGQTACIVAHVLQWRHVIHD